MTDTDTTETEALVRAFADRANRLFDAAEAARSDMAELKTEMKDAGFNVPALMRAILVQRQDKGEAEGGNISDLLLYADAINLRLDVAWQ